MTAALDGKVVLITGGGGGLGRGLCLAAASDGATVVVAAPRDNAATTVQLISERGDTAVWKRCDVTSDADVADCIATTVADFGRLDAIVHNATSGHSSVPRPLTDVTVDEWDDHVAVSLRAAYLLAHHGHPHLAEAGGRFVVMTSPAGMEGSTTLPAYSAMKGALRGFTKSLAIEWGPDQIAVTAVAPLSATPALANAFEKNPALEERLLSAVPLGRVGDPETDIGTVVSFLLSDASRYLTGQTLVVDGGWFTGL